MTSPSRRIGAGLRTETAKLRLTKGARARIEGVGAKTGKVGVKIEEVGAKMEDLRKIGDKLK